MKISRGIIKTAFKIREKATGKTFDCFIQDYPKLDGDSYTRFNIGINGWNEWSFICYLDEEEFNRGYEVL